MLIKPVGQQFKILVEAGLWPGRKNNLLINGDRLGYFGQTNNGVAFNIPDHFVGQDHKVAGVGVGVDRFLRGLLRGVRRGLGCGVGMAVAAQAAGQEREHIAVIGDGARIENVEEVVDGKVESYSTSTRISIPKKYAKRKVKIKSSLDVFDFFLHQGKKKLGIGVKPQKQ